MESAVKKPEGSLSRHEDYATIKISDKWVPLHRYVWELYNGPIPEGLHVHHKNGNKLCNCICNLELLTNAEHSLLHATGYRFSDAAKAKMSLSKKGRHLSEETKARVSSNLKGRHYGGEYEKLSSAGKYHRRKKENP